MSSLYLFRNMFIIMALISVILSLFFWTSMGNPSVSSDGFRYVAVNSKLCHTNNIDDRPHLKNKTDLKIIYYITPTYPRPEQMPELTRLAHTLMHVPRLHWIVADDQPVCSDLVLDLLKRTGLPFTHLSSPKPFRRGDLSRGVANRLAALSWIRKNVKEGILYFGDDDNTIDLQLFDQIRTTKKLSMFPVGLIGGFGVSSPIVRNGKVVGFFDSWPGSRTFPVDMAGFAVNIAYLHSNVTMPFTVGYEEDRFLVSLGFKIEDIEPLADNCSKVLVWHTKTLNFKKPTLKVDIHTVRSKYSNLVDLLRETSRMHMASLDPVSGSKTFVTINRLKLVI